MSLHDRDARVIVPTYRRLPLEIVRAEGTRVYDAAGNAYLDCFGGLAVAIIGHCHPEVVSAIRAQSERFGHLSNFFAQTPQVELAERLRDRTGYERVFFCNSGTEAAEAAVKLARKWGAARGKHVLHSFSGAFHGRSTGALSIMPLSSYRAGYEPLLEGCRATAFNDVDALEAAVSERTAAVFLEFLQGESGIVEATPEFAAALYRLREQYGFLLVADEVQSGMGRTGSFLACEHWGGRPDVVLLAKGLGGGLPLGAMLVTEELADVYGMGGHGSTFGGNAISCAAGIATLDVIAREELVARAGRIGERMLRGLRELRAAFPGYLLDARGRGCMLALECATDAAPLHQACLKRGLLVNVTHGRTIRFLPPLILTDDDVDEALHVLREAVIACSLEAGA